MKNATARSSGLRPAPAEEPTHQALCISCLRRSPVVHGDQRAAHARAVALGWVSTPSGALCCPVCVQRAAPPVLRHAAG